MQRLTEIILKTHIHPFFTSEDLSQYVSGTDDARHGLVKRAIAAGEIVRIRRGLYCLSREYRRTPINLFALAQYIYGPSYISLESALSHYGWIPEAVYTVTSVCIGESKTFRTPIGVFTYTRVPQNTLYSGVTRESDDATGTITLVARPLKALADYVYVYRRDWTTTRPVLNSLRIDRESLESVTSEDLDETLKTYRSRRVQRFLAGIRSELSL